MVQVAERKLTPKEAVEKALEYFSDLYGERNLSHVRFEGIRYDEASNQWEVTVGYDRPEGPRSQIESTIEQLALGLSSKELVREFRVVRLKADDGTFMELEHA